MPKTKEPKDKPKEVAKEVVAEAIPPPDASAVMEARRALHEARAEAFKALGDPIRLAICDYLANCLPPEQTAGAVCRAVTGDKKITAKVSHHLKELRRAGLIKMRKDGKNVLCGLDPGGAAALSAYLASWNEGRTLLPNDFNDKEGNPTDGDAAFIDDEIPDTNLVPALLVAA